MENHIDYIVLYLYNTDSQVPFLTKPHFTDPWSDWLSLVPSKYTPFSLLTAQQLKDLASYENAVKEFKNYRCACKNHVNFFNTAVSHRLAIHSQSPWTNLRQKYREGKICFRNLHPLESSLFAYSSLLLPLVINTETGSSCFSTLIITVLCPISYSPRSLLFEDC